ncbi:MAG: cytochrome c [Deltaproteobacteria bacterium]
MISLFLSRFSQFGFFTLLIPVLVFAAITFSSAAGADEGVAQKGQAIFKEKGCVACHSIGKGKITGPDLLGVTERREEEWLKQWLKSPDTMIYTDPIAKEMLKEYLVPMPNQGLSDEEIDILIEYFEYEDSKKAEK